MSGAFGSKPSILIPKSRAAKNFQSKTVVEGNGAVVQPGDYVKVQVTSRAWASGRQSFSTYDHSPGAVVIPVDASSGIPAIVKGLPGKKVGSRVLLIAPAPDVFGQGDHVPPGFTPSDTMLVVVDILNATHVDPHASVQGKQQAAGVGLPQVQEMPNGKPTLSIPPNTPTPQQLHASVLIRGKGEEIKKGQTVIAHYVGATYPDGKIFDSSWTKGHPIAFPLGKGAVVKGWDEGLQGKHVGDRVLLTVPAGLAYGSQPPPHSSIAKDAALAFVVDILGVV